MTPARIRRLKQKALEGAKLAISQIEEAMPLLPESQRPAMRGAIDIYKSNAAELEKELDDAGRQGTLPL